MRYSGVILYVMTFVCARLTDRVKELHQFLLTSILQALEAKCKNRKTDEDSHFAIVRRIC